MIFLSAGECADWCAKRGVDSSGVHPRFSLPGEQVMKLKLPSLGLKVVTMTGLLASLADGEPQQEMLVWLTGWGMWSESIDAVGEMMWKRILAGSGCPKPSPSDTRGAVFSSSEANDGRAILTAIMLFQWDAVLAAHDGSFFVRISHDGYINVHAKDGAVASILAAPIEAWRKVEERAA